MAAAKPTPATAAHAQAFRAWVLDDSGQLDELAVAAAGSLKNAVSRAAGDVATLAYVEAAGRLGSEFQSTLVEGLSWLSARTWFRPHQPPTLEADGIAAFGVALALHRRSADVSNKWLQELVVRSAGTSGLVLLDHSLFVAAGRALLAPGRQDATSMSPEVRLAVGTLGFGDVDEGCYSAAWERILRFTGGPEMVPEATLLLHALDVVTERNLPARLGRLDYRDVLHVLEGVHRSFRRWTWEDAPRTPLSAVAQWNIENEYHVQNILWAILAPLFPDLNEEETLPPVGPKNPRVDLSIPSVSTIIEVKFVRPTTAFQKVVEEIAADASLYATDPRWRSLIPFIWDDGRRTEEHPKLLAGLKQLAMVDGAVIVSRPARMLSVRKAAPQSGPKGLKNARGTSKRVGEPKNP